MLFYCAEQREAIVKKEPHYVGKAKENENCV